MKTILEWSWMMINCRYKSNNSTSFYWNKVRIRANIIKLNNWKRWE